MDIGAIHNGSASSPSVGLSPSVSAKSAESSRTLSQTSKASSEVKAQDNKPETSLSVEQAVKHLEKFVSTTNAEINFAVDTESGMQVVKVIDRGTKEVLRQFPSEEAINLAMALDKLQGLFVRDKA